MVPPAYDAGGNRTFDRSDLHGNYGRSYDPADNEDHIQSVGPLLYTYNEDGFLETKSNTATLTAEYIYNLGGELTQVDLQVKVINHTHDLAGRRIARSVDGVITDPILTEALVIWLSQLENSVNTLFAFVSSELRHRKYFSNLKADDFKIATVSFLWQGSPGRFFCMAHPESDDRLWRVTYVDSKPKYFGYDD